MGASIEAGKLRLNGGETSRIDRAVMRWLLRSADDGAQAATIDVPVYVGLNRSNLLLSVPLAASGPATAFLQRGVALVAEQ